MIKDNQKRLNRMHVLLDILVTVVAYALAWFIVISGKVLPLDEGVLKPQVYFMALIFIVPIYLILYASFHLYVPKRIQGRPTPLWYAHPKRLYISPASSISSFRQSCIILQLTENIFGERSMALIISPT